MIALKVDNRPERPIKFQSGLLIVIPNLAASSHAWDLIYFEFIIDNDFFYLEILTKLASILGHGYVITSTLNSAT